MGAFDQSRAVLARNRLLRANRPKRTLQDFERRAELLGATFSDGAQVVDPHTGEVVHVYTTTYETFLHPPADRGDG